MTCYYSIVTAGPCPGGRSASIRADHPPNYVHCQVDYQPVLRVSLFLGLGPEGQCCLGDVSAEYSEADCHRGPCIIVAPESDYFLAARH